MLPAAPDEVLACIVAFVRFLVPVLTAILLGCHFLKPPQEVRRKLLHMVAFFLAPVMIWASDRWQPVVVTLVAMGALLWPLLAAGERIPGFEAFFVQRRAHEVRRSMLLLIWGDAVLVAFCWGLCVQPSVAVASILMWGCGDAAAALVGKRFGCHHVAIPLADHKKTWEGSAAMLATSALVGFALQGLNPTVLVAAAVGAYVELITHSGFDTITVPFAVAIVLLLLGG